MQVIEKPWGKEELIEVNDYYMVKKLTMLSGHRCSLQYHEQKHETIFVLSGSLLVLKGVEKSNLVQQILEANDSVCIPPKTIHRMEAIDDCVYLEASTPQINDVIRLSDDYNRVDNR